MQLLCTEVLLKHAWALVSPVHRCMHKMDRGLAFVRLTDGAAQVPAVIHPSVIVDVGRDVPVEGFSAPKVKVVSPDVAESPHYSKGVRPRPMAVDNNCACSYPSHVSSSLSGLSGARSPHHAADGGASGLALAVDDGLQGLYRTCLRCHVLQSAQ